MTIQQAEREKYWPEVEQFFGGLPPHLFRQGLLLKNNLSVRYGETGQLKDILCREQDYPLLSFHFWLLDDLGLPQGQARTQLEKHLLLAMFFSFAAAYTHESILDQDSFFDDSFLFLEQVLTQREIFHFAQLFPEGADFGPNPPAPFPAEEGGVSPPRVGEGAGEGFRFALTPFWDYYRAFWDEYAEANLWEIQAHARKLAPGRTAAMSAQTSEVSETSEVWRRSVARLAPAKLSVVAVALHSGHEALLPQLLEMMDHLNLVFQARREILSLRRDLSRGVYTYPIVRTMMAAGMDWQAPFAPEQVLGAALLTGSIKEICQESLAELEICRETARELGLPTWLAYFDTVETITRELLGLFSLGAAGEPGTERQHTAFLPYRDALAHAIQVAEDYLLSDLTFRESWEVQRHVILDIPEVTCKAFPSGFIIELLCANGHDLAAQVDEVFRTLHGNDFRYYENFDIPPDADDLGLLLRLYRYSNQKGTHQGMLQKPLGWMESNVLPSGEIPVYFTRDVDVPLGPGNRWATSCISVEINILLGLIDYDWEQYRALIEKSALNLFERLLRNGPGLTANYDLLYALWVTGTLMAQLSARPVGAALRDKMEQAGAARRDRLAREAKRRFISPQDAAFLGLACLGHPAESLFRPQWITILLKNQRYDGSWEAEPFYPTPNRGGAATWYASRSITTAFCYHALQAYRKHGKK